MEKEFETIVDSVDVAGELMDNVILEIVAPYIQDLDDYVDFVRSLLQDEKNPPTVLELEEFCLNLPVYLYYASSMQEMLGLRDDISRALYRERYNSIRKSIDKGTVADKDVAAELASQHEHMASICYKRSHAIVKAKVLAGQELLSSCKKVLTRRMSESEITKYGT